MGSSNGRGVGGGIEQILQFVAVVQGLRGVMGGPESTIATQEQIADRPRAARETALNLTGAGLVMLAGMALHAWGWVFAVDGRLGLREAMLGLAVYLVLLLVPSFMLARRFEWPLIRAYLWVLATTWLTAFLLLVLAVPLEQESGVYWALGGLVISIAMLPLFYNQWRDLTDPYWRESPHEKAIQRDLFPVMRAAMAGGEGEAEEVRQVLEVRREENNEYILDSQALGVTPEQLLLFGHRLMEAGGNLAESRWGNSDVFASYPEYRAVRGRMQDMGLCRPVNPDKANSPFELTPRGRAGFRRLAEAYQQRAHAHTRTGG